MGNQLLAFPTGPTGGGGGASAREAALGLTSQQASATIKDHVEWEVFYSNGITVSTGAGQAAGIITLPANSRFLLFAQAGPNGTSTLDFIMEWHNETLAAFISESTLQRWPGGASFQLNRPNGFAFVETGGSAEDVVYRVNSGTENFDVVQTFCWIRELL
jgi:hypothetical protein